MLYGANGYTGRLIAREAVARGQRPLLAGRNRAAVEQLAAELSCPSLVLDLDDAKRLADAASSVRAVLHCAGPFSTTSAPMREACLAGGAHYLDITGEIDVIEAAAACDERARRAEIVMMPAVGFDVVPSDCLAATLAAELPTATHLELAFTGDGGLSPGTAKTAVEGLSQGGRARIDGHLVRVPVAWKTRDVPFERGRRTAVTIPWGDLASAWHTTGIPNIETYLAMPKAQITRIRRVRWLLPLAGVGFVQQFLKGMIERRVHGPDAAELADSRSSLWGRVRDDAGREVEATLETLGGYPLTVAASLATLDRILGGGVPAGFQTPARALGKDFILEMPDTQLWIGGREVSATRV